MGAFAWPMAFIILGTIFIYKFSEPISRLIDRIIKIDRKGISAIPSQPQRSMEASKKQTEELMKSFDSHAIRFMENAIEKDPRLQLITSDQDKVKVLTRQLSAAQLMIRFEQVYREIFGSQINLLQFLNSRPQGETDENLKVFYDHAVTEYPNLANYPYTDYLNYLHRSGLITRRGEFNLLSQLGRAFLEYLIREGYSLTRVF